MWLLLAAAAIAQVNLEDSAAVARGGVIFANSCGVGYCHGKAGAAGRGPRLAGRKFDREYLIQVITTGSSNGNMPGFAKTYSAEDIRAVTAYILSLSGTGGASGEVGTASTPAGAGRDAFAAGRAVFEERCSVCHVFQGKGVEIGPDLTGQSQRRAEDIRRDILDPGARLSIDPVVVVTKSGERVAGVKKQENRELIRVYDTSSLPPVLRTIYKDQVQSVGRGSESPMPGNFGKVLTPQQLADLVAFLKGGP